ncbi:MAG: PfkB family carbohydrate kinase [Treponema sp.]|jgi:sugar/nucleoside kinase (ribokinase family)|nr:PfkB family carbohydrate kinase [Treponema sp.]
MAETDLLCIGNAIVDVFINVDAGYMDRQGIREPIQHIPREQADLIIGESLSGGGAPVFCSGGGAANVAKITALLNMSAAFTGCTGQDELAAVFEKDIMDAGVLPFLTRGTEKTGVCLVLSDTEETRIAASPGAALELTDADVREDLLDNTDMVVFDGYMLERRSLVQRILQLANRHGIPVALDAASVFQIREKTEEILHYSRNYPLIIFMNADESIVFYNTIRKTSQAADIRNEQEKEGMILRDICPILKLITDGEIFPIFVVKLGSRGAVVVAGGTIYREETFAVSSRNTMGAGDAFSAAFLSAWIRGKSLSECASMGNKVAREILEAPGTRIEADKLKAFSKQLKPCSRHQDRQ